jgi:hypothetical protein
MDAGEFNCCLNDKTCSAENFTALFTLGTLPLGNPVKRSSGDGYWRQDLSLSRCSRCAFIQTAEKVPGDKLADENFYVSGFSSSVVDSYKKLIRDLSVLPWLSKGSGIMEIGCGDGTLLRLFRENGYTDLTGIEPNVHESHDSFEVIHSFFNADTARELKRSNKVPDLIILNSVIETIPQLGVFFSDLAAFMKMDSHVFIEVPYFFRYISDKRIDAFSHLTSNWFSANSFHSVMDRFGYQVVDFEVDEAYRGGSVKLMAKRTDAEHIKHCAPFLALMEKERLEYPDDYFKVFRGELNTVKDSISRKIDELASEGYTIVAYGGGLKAATLINWIGEGAKQITFAVDMDPKKHGRFVSGTAIEIGPLSEMDTLKKIAVFNCALNFTAEVLTDLKERLPAGTKMIIPLPVLELITF